MSAKYTNLNKAKGKSTMTIDIITACEGLAGAITAIGGIYSGTRHILASSRRKKEEYRQSILNQASQEMAKIKSELEEKIKDLEVELAVQKENLSRDIGHMREIYNAEIKVLADKIDSLRTDLQDQHSTMVNLLTKLVNSK